MAQGVNRVTLIGNLGQDPVVRQNPATGKNVCTLSIATTNEWENKTSGKKVSKTQWHQVVLFGAFVETAKKHLTKGSKIYVEGYLSTKTYIPKDGIQKSVIEIICTYMQMLGGGTKNKNNGNYMGTEDSDDSEDVEIMGNNNMGNNNYDDIPF